MLSLTAVLLSAGLGLHLMADRRTLGVGYWAAGNVLFAAGLALIAFREELALPLSGAAAVFCAVAGLLTVRLGLRRFLGKGGLSPSWWALLAGAVAFNGLFFDLPPVHLRIAGNTVVVAVAALGLSLEFLHSDMDGLHRWVGGALCLFIALHLGVRAAAIAADPGVIEPLTGGRYGAWAFMAMTVWTRPMRW